jgi:hypothetical protein
LVITTGELPTSVYRFGITAQEQCRPNFDVPRGYQIKVEHLSNLVLSDGMNYLNGLNGLNRRGD